MLINDRRSDSHCCALNSWPHRLLCMLLFCQAAEIMSTSTFISGCAAAALCKSPSGTGGGGRRTMEKVVYTSLRINEAGGGFGVREGEAE